MDLRKFIELFSLKINISGKGHGLYNKFLFFGNFFQIWLWFYNTEESWDYVGETKKENFLITEFNYLVLCDCSILFHFYMI